MSITIRRATVEDAELVARLNQPIQQQHADALPHIFKPACVDDVLIAHFRAVMAAPDNVMYIPEVDGVPAGYMCCIIQNRPENPFSYAQRILLVDAISVNPEFQRRGIGNQLIEAAMMLAAKHACTQVALDVWAFNDGAIAFYEAHEFKKYGHRMRLFTGL